MRHRGRVHLDVSIHTHALRTRAFFPRCSLLPQPRHLSSIFSTLLCLGGARRAHRMLDSTGQLCKRHLITAARMEQHPSCAHKTAPEGSYPGCSQLSGRSARSQIGQQEAFNGTRKCGGMTLCPVCSNTAQMGNGDKFILCGY